MGFDGTSNEAIHPPPQKVQRVPEPPKRYVQEPIAVVGMACRLPGNSNNPHQLWEFLEGGGIAHNEAPESRFKLATHYDGSKKPKTMRSPGGMFLESIDPSRFDAAFFGISKTDAIAMDPQQRQLLEVVYECLENSGKTLDGLDGSLTGCFVGSYAVDYADMQARDPEDRAPSVTVGVGRAILSNRISHFLNIHGPSMTIDTACSGSLVGVDVACRYLSTGEVNGAIVAAANLYLSPEHNMDGGAMKGASSPSGRCHTFDVKADGYIKAEAVNALYLKRLSDAIRDGDPIRAVIRGTATNSDGKTPGIASPSAEAQALAIRAAYANAGITNFNDTQYVECHGTGTQAGDPTEVGGVSSVFGVGRSIDSPLIIGSVKSNIGHSEPAAGISGLIKTILALEKGVIPGNPTFIDPNPKIDFEGLKVRASRTNLPWPKNRGVRRASVNSFGYGGSNVHVVVESAPSTARNALTSRVGQVDDLFSDDAIKSRPTILVLSANDENSIETSFKVLSRHLANPSTQLNLKDLAHTLGSRRTHHFNRGFITTRKFQLDENSFIRGKKANETPRVGFVFTGQGAQWPQMGKDLVENFPQAYNCLKNLDDVLKSLSHPPTWSLLDELCSSRSPEALRQPEFSQPLVTALQLAILSIFDEWGVKPQAVVGHSSGEIAAACAAGLMSPEDAIKAAYYRGYAAKVHSDNTTTLGMMAVGLGAESVQRYLKHFDNKVSIACHNSPNSVTLSGTINALEQVKDRLQADSHFARLLQVSLAYHSDYMKDIARHYVEYLSEDLDGATTTKDDVVMFSSVTGKLMSGVADVAYWQANMVSPVLFKDAVTDMLTKENAPNFLIEIGPSGALKGPLTQNRKALPGGGDNIIYCASLSRGQEAISSTFEVAGRLFIAGGEIDIDKVNQDDRARPKMIVDLPNYAWSHGKEYWYESEASKDWRYRNFPHHDLIGSKVLGTSWHTPSWHKSLRLEDLPWLRDHKMGDEVVFPGAGYIAMAMEAIYQMQYSLDEERGESFDHSKCYRMRNVAFPKALVLEDKQDHKVQIALTTKGTWKEFTVLSLSGDTWETHSQGLIRLEREIDALASEDDKKSLKLATPGFLWYKAMFDAGYNFGPCFQKQTAVESISGERRSRSQVSLEAPESENPQSVYAMHPACMDGCFQTCAPALWKGNRSGVNAVLVPAIIDDLVIRGNIDATIGLAISTSEYVGLGRPEETKNYLSNTTIFDQESGAMILRLSGLRYHKLDTRPSLYDSHKYTQVSWRPDVKYLTQDGLSHFLDRKADHKLAQFSRDQDNIDEVIDLAAHKKPNLSVLEINDILGDNSSLWIREGFNTSPVRAACKKFHYTSKDATSLVGLQDKHESDDHMDFSLLVIDQDPEEFESPETSYDLAILRMQSPCTNSLSRAIKNTTSMLLPGALLFVIDSSASSTSSSEEDLVVIQNDSEDKQILSDARQELNSLGISKILEVSCGKSAKARWALLAEVPASLSPHETSPKNVNLITLSPPSSTEKDICTDLEQQGWNLKFHAAPYDKLQPGSISLVLSELTMPILPDLSSEQLQLLKKIFTAGTRILWVVRGTQHVVTDPNGALIHGLSRTIRSEDPSISITTLDVEDTSGLKTISSIDTILATLQSEPSLQYVENEYAERHGILEVCRLLPDHALNHREEEIRQGVDLTEYNLHSAKTCVRMHAERVGTVDSLQYTEIFPDEVPLKDNCVEVDIAAAGLNFKDVAITMGIVPENQFLLGLEGAGTVRRVGRNLNSRFHIGQRVLVFEKGCFANRIQLTTERAYPIPDSMSFEEAATLASVYLTALYSIYDLADTQKGQRVLIHSATGGLGIASIQICQYIGTEIFATVGTAEKREFLTKNFGIPTDHIFDSRSTSFGPELMKVTNGGGVDVILNSLAGDLLDESWRCIANSGTMVELGKKDMLDRNSLSMEPFGRNASYRCFDMSHKCVTDILIARLLKQLFSLIEAGHVGPIKPIKTFPFEDIPAAFRFMRGANHIGKIIISNHGITDIKVPVRRALRQLTLRPDVSYLIIGGLKGLCGSLAVDMAKLGAKHLVVLQRSGYDDDKSQATITNIAAEGCHVECVSGDVSKAKDVHRAFLSASVPIAGVIQGAMVLRDRPFESMTIEEYHTTISSKVQGTWHLHNTAQNLGLQLDFFTMLSSISGLVGQKGQANYAAANVFLDSFAAYRNNLGLRANTVDLGAIEDVGYMHQHSKLMTMLDTSAWTPINEGLFHKIVRYSIQQQVDPINKSSASQLVTSLAVPQADSSLLLSDARFAPLVLTGSAGAAGASDASDGGKEIKAFLLMVKSGQADATAVLDSCIGIVNAQFTASLRLGEPMEPAKPLSSYGLDSLSAVEFRNWARLTLGADLTTLEVSNASSLIALCQKIVSKISV